jgi:hypothetical protein
MIRAAFANLLLVGLAFAGGGAGGAAAQASPDGNLAAPPSDGRPRDVRPAPSDAEPAPRGVPRAVSVARTTMIPRCTVFVDAAAADRGDGTVRRPHPTIAAAVDAASPGAVICVAEGVYPEQIKPGEKYFILAGGFRRGSDFRVRDSAAHVSRAAGRGGSFIRVEGSGPKGDQLTAIDGFEITGYAQAIVRDHWESQRFDITNNHIHGNRCADDKLAGGAFALNNVSGWIVGNVIRNNSCGRGGAGLLNDPKQENTVTIERNLIDANAGTEPDSAHGGGLYVFGKMVRITGNLFTRNTVTNWGGGLYIGAWTDGGHHTTAHLNWNVYRDNRAGVAGGGMFCDDGATCVSYHEIYERNCGSNIYLDSGTSVPTTARFGHLTNVGALAVGCSGPGAGVRIDKGSPAADTYSFVDAIFWDNAPGLDLVANCDANCGNARISVSYSMVQTRYGRNGLTVAFGDGIVAPADPLFADPANGDFHLKSTAGRWTPRAYVRDSVSSPALAKGHPGDSSANPERAGKRNELGAYGNSVEASFVR